ncbi:glycosyl transferase family 1 [Sulfurifustis variabilis]|uniref:Glycosyl transferase family 1 n=1 Tax=Sulfurifustis variabilis TaxID=1675686 RepID=A0A1B4V4X7_9GAMM|nr:glycosyltransferase family 4 protein [Sulfurifustis variabilis]BAU48596.1 glycosyl transferase family 1 [Sulfurifustis variabilis]
MARSPIDGSVLQPAGVLNYRLKGKLLYIVNDAGFFLSHRLPLAVAARMAGMEVHVATPADATSGRIVAEGFHFHAIDIHRWRTNPWREARSLVAMIRLLRRLRPDIVHNVTIKPVLYGGIAARLTRQRAVVSAIPGLGTVFIDSSGFGRVRRAIVKWIYRQALRHPNSGVIFQNEDDLRSFTEAGLTDARSAVLIRGSGLDLQSFIPTPLPQGVPVVMLASRMVWDKGVGEFVRAAMRVHAAGVAARFVLVGEPERGNPRSVAREQLDEWQRAGIVEWWGRRTDMPEVLSRAYLVCLPSYREGLPKVLIEAAACGRPLIAADVPGCREVVRHEANGLLVRVRDSDALAAAFSDLLQDRVRAENMGRYSRHIAEAEFGVGKVIDDTMRVYEKLLSK